MVFTGVMLFRRGLAGEGGRVIETVGYFSRRRWGYIEHPGPDGGAWIGFRHSLCRCLPFCFSLLRYGRPGVGYDYLE